MDWSGRLPNWTDLSADLCPQPEHDRAVLAVYEEKVLSNKYYPTAADCRTAFKEIFRKHRGLESGTRKLADAQIPLHGGAAERNTLGTLVQETRNCVRLLTQFLREPP